MRLTPNVVILAVSLEPTRKRPQPGRHTSVGADVVEQETVIAKADKRRVYLRPRPGKFEWQRWGRRAAGVSA